MASNQSKRILMIAYTNYATDPRVFREAEAALSGGFAVDVLALRRPDDPPVEEIRGVQVIHVRQVRYRGTSRIGYVFAYLEFFARCLVRTTALHVTHRYDVIHVNNMPDFLVFSALVPKLLGCRVVLDIHDPMPDTFTSKFTGKKAGAVRRILLWQEQLSAWFADAVLTVHEPVKRGILLKHGLKDERIHVVANFADENIFPLNDRYAADGTIRMVFHGTVLERYGLGDLLSAVSRMRDRSNLHLTIIGEGDFSPQVSRMITDLDLTETVTFDNRFYPTFELASKLRNYNLGVAPLQLSHATDHALPLKLLEYVSMGMPVITVPTYAIRFYFSDRDCFFYDPNDPGSLVRVLDAIVSDPALLRNMRERTLAIRDRFTWTAERRKYLALLDSLMHP